MKLRARILLVSVAFILAIVLGADVILSKRLDSYLTGGIRDDLFARLALVERAADRETASLADLDAWDALADLRATYELFVSALAELVLVPLPPWIAPDGALDDWETSAWDDEFASLREKLNKVLHSR